MFMPAYVMRMTGPVPQPRLLSLFQLTQMNYSHEPPMRALKRSSSGLEFHRSTSLFFCQDPLFANPFIKSLARFVAKEKLRGRENSWPFISPMISVRFGPVHAMELRTRMITLRLSAQFLIYFMH
jgi:hypothetical protein